MEKLILLVRGGDSEPRWSFKNRIDDLGKRILSDIDPVALWYTVTEGPPPAISIIPFQKDKIAAISIVGSALASILSSIDTIGLSAAYRVEEALPVAYDKDWPDGRATPGVCLLTLFRKKKDVDYKTFISRWHNGHTPLSLKIHPLWQYNRNVVKETLDTTNHEMFDGVVEEHFRTAADLLNPVRFFGNPFNMLWNMITVYKDVRSFIDYPSIQPYYCTEYQLRSASYK